MYRILVVDNEPYVVDWIAFLIETKSRQEVDVCRAYTAKEALQWLGKTRIDVLVSDISMPGMDGLELAGIVKEQWPYAKVVLITAYAEFDYAVTAIRNNVVGYVLKNQGDDVIFAEIERAMELVEIQIEHESREPLQDIHYILPMLQSRLLQDILENDGDFDERKEEQLQSVGIFLKADTSVRIMLCDIRNGGGADDVVKNYYARQDIIAQVEKKLGDFYSIWPVLISGRRVVWLLHLQQPERFQMQENALIQGRIELLQDTVKPECSFVLYAKPVCLRDVKEIYAKLEKTIGRMTPLSETFFIAEGTEVKDVRIDIGVISRRIGYWLEENRKELFLNAIAFYEDKIRQNALGQEECYNLYYTIAIQLNCYLEKLEIPETQDMLQLKRQLFYPPADGSWTEKFEDLSVLFRGTVEAEERIKSGIIQNTVDELKKYIREHIQEDISLTRLSEVTGYNTNYLSRIFRLQTGKTLTEYIAWEKLERIGSLMRDPARNITDIAEETGFRTRTYFNRFMKKWTGKSPKDYRNELLRQ